MTIGEMLLRDGRVTRAQLDEAMAVRKRDGGRLGSLLVELGHIDAETLTIYLGLELGMPIATGATLERCKRSAVRLLTPQQATRYHCIPVVIQGQTLIVAIDDPHDLQALDALHQITGYRILPRIAPEIRLHYYLERFYGVPRPARYRALGEQARGNANGVTAAGLPGPPLPGLPPRRDSPVAAPTPVPTLRRPSTAALAAIREHEALELDANDLVDELEADEAEPAAAVEPTAAPAIARSTKSFTAPRIDFATARAAMAETDERSVVAERLLAYSIGRFEVAVLCLVRDTVVVGWKGFGPGLDDDRIETLLVPVESASLFQAACSGRELVQGRAAAGVLHDHVFKVLRCAPPASSVVVPILIGPRVVNVLYAHRPGGTPLPDAELAELRELAAAAGAAYVRLIAESKRKQGSLTGSPQPR
jgi:hypothetical protein